MSLLMCLQAEILLLPVLWPPSWIWHLRLDHMAVYHTYGSKHILYQSIRTMTVQTHQCVLSAQLVI